jgi:YVTN family beta-propeller protein
MPADQPTPSHGIGMAPDGKTLWVTSLPNNAVFVYALNSCQGGTLRGHGPIAAVPNWVTFTPDSTTIYISNAALRSVTAIDMASMRVVATIPVGEVPKRINTLVLH